MDEWAEAKRSEKICIIFFSMCFIRPFLDPHSGRGGCINIKISLGIVMVTLSSIVFGG